jgi:hypothetical protein
MSRPRCIASPRSDTRRGRRRGVVAGRAHFADFDPQGAEERQRVDRFEGADLPGHDLVRHRLSAGQDAQLAEIAEMLRDLAHDNVADLH